MRKQYGTIRLTAAALIVLLLSLALPSAVAETFSAIVTAEEMTVYRDAKLQARSGELSKDTVVRIQAYAGKAAKITYAGKTGYAKVADMKAVDDVAKKAVVNANARVYKTASAKAKSVKVKKGAKVYVLSTSGIWAQVEKDGAVGYMKASVLTRADDDWRTSADPTPTPAPEKGTVVSNTLPVYKKANTGSGKLGTLKKGQVIDVLKWNSKWAYVELKGKYGYCAVKGLVKGEQEVPTPTPAPTEGIPAVTTKKLNVYSKAGDDGKKLGTLKKSQSVNLIKINGKWACIELGGRYGYCSAAALTISGGDADPTPPASPTSTPSTENAVRGTVNVKSLTVYKTASARGSKVTALSKGTVVNVLKWNSKWAFIEHKGKYGFSPVAGLSKVEINPTDSSTTPPSLDKAIKAFVSAESVSVYKTASDSSEELGVLMWGEEINVLATSNGWAYIEKGGKYGFCAQSALTKSEAGPTETPSGYKKAGFTATVVYPGARAYESASTGSRSVGLRLGQEVNVLAYSKSLEWACISNGKARGFVPLKQLSHASYSVIKSDGSALQTLLKALLTGGYYDGVPTTTLNTAAVTAVKRFQAACGLEETGIPDITTQRILYAGYAPVCDLLSKNMTSGDSGADVRRVQLRLYALGYLSKPESLDSNYGITTATAVGLFQKASAIGITGVADPATLKALYSTGAASLPSTAKAADDGGAVIIDDSGVVNPPNSVKLSSTYVTTMPASLKSTTSSYSESMSSRKKLEHVIYSAQEKLTKPYVYGATGPNSFDCSGLTYYAFKKVGVSLKRSAYSQGYDSGYDKISGTGSLRRGDLVFFNTISDSDLCDHAGIYLGGGCFIHASSGGHKVVVSNLTTGYYNRVFSWGRRVLK